MKIRQLESHPRRFRSAIFSRSTPIYEWQVRAYSGQYTLPLADTARCIPSIQ